MSFWVLFAGFHRQGPSIFTLGPKIQQVVSDSIPDYTLQAGDTTTTVSVIYGQNKTG